MARMYSRKKGRSGSTKPEGKTVPSWCKDKNAEKLVLELAKQGKNSAQIGIELRDLYGIPDVKTITGKSIGKILTEAKAAPELPDDLMALLRRSVMIRKHLELNHKDMTAKRGLQLTDSKVRRLVKYYKSIGRLPLEWKFDPKRMRMYVE